MGHAFLEDSDQWRLARWGELERGVPVGPGAIAEFTVPGAGSGTALITFNQNQFVTIGTLNIVTDGDDAWRFMGNTGLTNATLRFLGNSGSPAFINATADASVRTTNIAAINAADFVLV